MSKIKYTKSLLEPIVKDSTSVAQVIRKLGLREAGGTHSHLTKKLKEFELDTSHFLGQGHGLGHVGGTRKPWKDVLKKRKSGGRQKSYQLRRALIESGRKYECEECGLGPHWNGKKLRLQVDHRNSDWLDDRQHNLKFICPNCHTQTPGYNGSKGISEVTRNWRK